MKKEFKIKLPVALQAYTASAESIAEEVKLSPVLWTLIDKLYATNMLPKEIATYLSLDEASTYQLIEQLVEIGVITEVEGTSYSEWKDMEAAPVVEELAVLEEEKFTETVEQSSAAEDRDFLVDELENEAEERVSFEIT